MRPARGGETECKMHLIPVSRRRGWPRRFDVTKNLPPTATLTTDDFALLESSVNSDISDMANLVGTLHGYLVSVTVANCASE